MITDLRDSIIFLHGLSGSGKGEIKKKLAEKYSTKEGYSTIYVSSGALFRAALSNPTIAEKVRAGYFFDTLVDVMPGIEEMFGQFITRWVESKGKAIIILDGAIRRGAFEKEGPRIRVRIPSQIEQISVGLHNSIKKLVSTDKDFVNYFPGYDSLENGKEEALISDAKTMLKEAIHIVADVLPEDAEAQIKRRADKEIKSIKIELQDKVTAGQLGEGKMQQIKAFVDGLEAIMHSPEDKNRYQEMAAEAKKITENLAVAVGLEKSATLNASLESVGVSTELRDDDISPIGREKRIKNYLELVGEKDGERMFAPGFATQALTEDLKFKFNPSGSFRSESGNCIVIANGQNRGIDLKQFQEKCEFQASRLFQETESQREKVFGSREGQVRREREI